MIPPPLVPMRGAYRNEVPDKAWRLVNTATAHGWAVRITYVRGYQADGGDWAQVRTRTYREPVVGEDGKPALTPTGKPKMREVDTSEPLVVDSVAIRLRRGGRAAWAVYIDGEYECGQTSHPWATVKITSLLAWIKEPA